MAERLRRVMGRHFLWELLDGATGPYLIAQFEGEVAEVTARRSAFQAALDSLTTWASTNGLTKEESRTVLLRQLDEIWHAEQEEKQRESERE